MIEFRPNALYSRADLAELLGPLGLNVDGFIRKVNPVRRFRLAYWGADLIEAINRAEPITLHETPALPPPRASTGRSRGGRRRATSNPLEPLERLLRNTKSESGEGCRTDAPSR